jgi:hypothetical protein
MGVLPDAGSADPADSGQAQQRDACRKARRGDSDPDQIGRGGAEIFGQLAERQQRVVSPRWVGPESTQADAEMAVLLVRVHLWVWQRAAHRAQLAHQRVQVDERQLAAQLTTEHRALAELLGGLPEVPAGARLQDDQRRRLAV